MEKKYGKLVSELTKDEKVLQQMDNGIVMLGMIISASPVMAIMSMMGQGPMKKHILQRTVFAGHKLLGLPLPQSDDEFKNFSDKVEESIYGFNKMVDEMSEQHHEGTSFLEG